MSANWGHALWVAMCVEHGLAISAAESLLKNGHKFLTMGDYDRMAKALLRWASREIETTFGGGS